MIYRSFLLLICLSCLPALLTAEEATPRDQIRRYIELTQTGSSGLHVQELGKDLEAGVVFTAIGIYDVEVCLGIHDSLKILQCEGLA